MTDTHNTSNSRNASLTDFDSNTTTETTTVEHDPDVETVSTPTDEEHTVFDLGEIEDQHLKDLVIELSIDELRALITSLGDDGNVLDAVAEATSNEELANNIESVNEHYADRPSLVEAAGDYIANEFGCRPFDLTVTEPDNDFQSPMVCLDVDDDVVLTESASLNSELLVHATRINGVTEDGQRRIFNRWRDAIGGERVVEFKRDRDPDSLGFSIPGHIPATGDSATRTPITEIPYIGEKTAEEIHPTGDLMSIEDYASLTNKQLAWVEFPVDNRDYDSPRARGIARGIVEHVPPGESVADLLGKALNMMDRRGSDGDMAWANPAYTFGVTDCLRPYDDAEQEEVTGSYTDEDGRVIVTFDNESDAVYSQEYWGMITEIEEVIDADIESGPRQPAFLELDEETGAYIVIAPINPEEEEESC